MLASRNLRHSSVCPLLLRADIWNRMNLTGSPSSVASTSGVMDSSSTNLDANSKKVASVQSILKSTNSWEQCWAEEVTPWDLGRVTPLVADLVKRNDVPAGRALVPGCGLGYDVVALASHTRHAIGLDISVTAIERAQKLWAWTESSTFEFLSMDFFDYTSGVPFDLILDYTFFCALEPSLRPLWGTKVSELLASEGELITIMFPVDTHNGGPPYAVSMDAYEKVLHPHGLRCTFFQENRLAVEKRKGREFWCRWRRLANKL